MNFFISDYHFQHNKDFIYKSRGFNSIEEHDEFIIKSHNETVTEKDTTFFLGDFSFKKIEQFITKMNGKFICILGNHDHELIKYYNSDKNYKIIKIDKYIEHKVDNEIIFLCHFPMIVWNNSHRNNYMAHGHIHGITNFPGKIMNVTVDAIGPRPINEIELLNKFRKLPDNPDYLPQGREIGGSHV
jgi:calcineurin-like phosphoesterase family protein